ncbi:hypothetical protein ACEWPM_002715 [Roseovarius sp. S4756]|uniref:hypothetical protein n=1 Tax=Roseovarius maritimus TaxID=3342637 RepID=UPI003726C345
MHMPIRQDWTQGSAAAHLEIMRRARRGDLIRLARSYDWTAHPEAVLGWIMAQRRIDLGTALAVFLRGEPERFNYMPKRDVAEAHQPAARLLDNICLRINSGFYLPTAPVAGADKARLIRWIEAQQADRTEGTNGRWVLDEQIVSAVMQAAEHDATGAERAGDQAMRLQSRSRGAGRGRAGAAEWLRRAINSLAQLRTGRGRP